LSWAFQTVSSDIFAHLDDLKSVNALYEKLALSGVNVSEIYPAAGQTSGSGTPMTLKNMAETANKKWRCVSEHADKLNRKLKMQTDEFADYMAAVEELTIGLTKFEGKLNKLERSDIYEEDFENVLGVR
jgi:predicted nuclease with RNAse H fold